MKTAGRETEKRYKNRVASRAQGTEGKNNPAQWGGLDGKKNSGQRRSVFSLTPFMERIRLRRAGAHFWPKR
jgi:hypothetical protein